MSKSYDAIDIDNNRVSESSFGSTDGVVVNGNSTSDLMTGYKKPQKHWVITPVHIFIIVLAALGFSAIIGLIVGLAHPDRGKTCPIIVTDPTIPTELPSTTPITTVGEFELKFVAS